ncbi:MAG: hypothetical protein GKC04_03280 [Methanomicrobiales archaeon]|nr:hypothetical protein [Methanomicrobiales archaeon]
MKYVLPLLFATLGALQEMDVITTYYIIRVLGGVELNPFLVSIIAVPELFIMIKILFLLSLASIISCLEYILVHAPEMNVLAMPRWISAAMLGAACTWYIAAVCHNVYTMVSFA